MILLLRRASFATGGVLLSIPLLVLASVHKELEAVGNGVEIKKLEGVLFLNVQLLLW